MSEIEINDCLSSYDKNLAKTLMYRVYGMPGALFVDYEEGGDEPGPGPEPTPETRLVCTYDIQNEDVGSEIRLFGTGEGSTQYEIPYTSIEIDGVVLAEVPSTYRFDTPGIHTVKYELAEDAQLFFSGIEYLYTVEIPGSVTYLKERAFAGCPDLISVVLPETMEEIASRAFYDCVDLYSVTSLNPNPPQLASNEEEFSSLKTMRLLVPEESVESYRNSNWYGYFSDRNTIWPLKPENLSNDEIWYLGSEEIDTNNIDPSHVLDENENSLTLVSHTFENGIGKLKFSGNVYKLTQYFAQNLSVTFMLPSSFSEYDGWVFYSVPDPISYGTMDGYNWGEPLH